jgi:insulysin
MRTLFLLIACFSVLAADDSFQRVENKATTPILTPALAERKVAKIRLNNGLEAYLISDPGVDQSAAALAVEAGSWKDPREYPGMAHFCEHMLFMGNQAYPKEFEYMQYISDNGGSVNAYTATDRTVYMFSINNEAFEGAIDRFCHFFIDPLFLPSCINRELHAVDQEHAKNIENDDWREYMILKETGNPNHPNAGFSTGNARTLSGIPQEAVKQWYRENYSANRMHLVALSSLPIEEMVQLAVEKFSNVPNYQHTAAAYPPDLFSDQQRGHTIYVQPVRDLRKLSLLWQVPQEIALDNDKKVLELVSYALSNGAENSLIQELKREKLAEAIHVSPERISKDQTIFQIVIELTESGVKQTDAVAARCFQAVARLKQTGVPQYIFDEMRTMALINYQYQSREEAFPFIMETGTTIMYEKLESFPEKTAIPQVYDPHFIAQFLESLTPESCVFIVSADPKLTGIAPTVKEKWMSAAYTIKEIPQTRLTAWADIKTHPQIGLPPANPYIPQNLNLLPSVDASTVPVIVAQDSGTKVYFAQDKKYLVPEMAAILSIKTPQMDGSAKSRTLFDLYLYALNEKLYSTLFFAQRAGLQLTSGQQDLDTIFMVAGYNEKAPLFLKTVCQSLSHVAPTQDQFEIYKQALLTSYDNGSKELPVRQASEILSSIVYNDAPTSPAKYKALKSISYEEFISFSSSLFKKSYAQGLFYGNLSLNSVSSLWSELKPFLAASPYTVDTQTKKSVLVLPDKQGPYLVSQNTERQGNGVILMLQEGPFSFERKAAQQILSKALQDAFFDTLRTKQQTGYLAKAWDAEVEKQLLQLFAVQSITHQPIDLLARFELFLEDFNHNIRDKISMERFENIRSMLIKTLEMPPENLQGMALRLNTLAFRYDGDFQWIDKRIEGVKNMSYDNLVKTAHEFLSRNNLKRIAVLMEGVLPADNVFRYEAVSQEDVVGIGKFVSSR